MKKTTMKIEKDLIKAVREKFPELKDVSDSDVVRIILRKVLERNMDE